MGDIRSFDATIAAGGLSTLIGPANLIRVEEASGPLEISRDHEPAIVIRSGSSLASLEEWRIATIKNNNDVAVRVRLRYGVGVVPEQQYQYAPPTVNDGVEDFNLADGANLVISGIDSNGRRRKHFTITCKPGMAGKVLVYNNRTGRLIGIVGASSAGGGFREETDDDIKIVNATGANIQNTGSTPDVAISQVFYR